MAYGARYPIFIFCLSIAYAMIRYSYFGPVDSVHWPAFILNKAVAVFAVAMLCYSGWHYCVGQREVSKSDGRIAWHAALIHSGLSLALLSPSYYAKFYLDGRYNLAGEILIAFGVMSLYCLWQIGHHNGRRQHRLKQAACLLALAHLLPMASGWLTPSAWHGAMPPMSLISALLCSGALLSYARYKSSPTAAD